MDHLSDRDVRGHSLLTAAARVSRAASDTT
jgi:hypothetical protein